MKQVNNGFSDRYYMDEQGKIYDSTDNCYIKLYNDNRYILLDSTGQKKKKSIKTLYELVYHRAFSIDKIPDIAGEQWKKVDDFGYYYISNKGRMKSYKGINARLLHGTITENGYERIELSIENERICKFIDYFVAAAFLGSPNSITDQIHHKNYNKLNNDVSNLCYLSPKEHNKIHREAKRKEKETCKM